MSLLNPLESVVKKLREMEDQYTIIFKIDLFSDLTGDAFFMPDGHEPWKYAFPFSSLENLSEELVKFEDFLSG